MNESDKGWFGAIILLMVVMAAFSLVVVLFGMEPSKKASVGQPEKCECECECDVCYVEPCLTLDELIETLDMMTGGSIEK